MSAVRWSLLSLLVALGAGAPGLRAAPPSPAPQTVYLDIVIAKAQPGVAAALAGRLARQLPPGKVGKAKTPNRLAAVLASPKGAVAILALLRRLEGEGFVKATVIPRLATKSGQAASLKEGGLNVLPTALGDGRVHLEIEPDANKAIRLATKANLASGQTFLLGGFGGPGDDTELIILVTPTIAKPHP